MRYGVFCTYYLIIYEIVYRNLNITFWMKFVIIYYHPMLDHHYLDETYMMQLASNIG